MNSLKEFSEVSIPEEKFKLIYDIIEKRETNVKHFRLRDNKYRAIEYPYDVHYPDENGNLVDIDNTLIKDSSLNGQNYSNANNNFKVSFIEKTKKNQGIMDINLDKYQVDLSVKDALEDINAIIKNPDTCNCDELLIPKISSSASYLNSFAQNDIIFNFVSQSVDCVLDYTSLKVVPIPYILKLKNLHFVQDGDKIFLVDKNDQTKTVFSLNQNFMQGKMGISEKCAMEIAIENTIDPVDSTEIEIVSLTLNPILNAQEIVNTEDGSILGDIEEIWDDAHVILSISAAVQVTSLLDTVVTSYNPTGNYVTSQYLGVGLNSNGGVERSFVKISTLPVLHSGDMVTSAKYHLTSFNAVGNNQVNISEPAANWDPTTLTWNNQPLHSNIIRDFKIIKSTYTNYEFDITFLVNAWYNNFANYGFVLFNNNEAQSYNIFYSSKNSVNKPFVTIDYINCTGLDSMWTYHTISAGIAGTVNIHDNTGNACLVIDDVVLTGNLMPIYLQHVYNSNDKDVDLGYGLGFRLSYMQTVGSELNSSGALNYVHTNSTGRKLYYTKQIATNTYQQDLDSDTTLTIDSSNLITITDKSNNRIKFDSSGRLINLLDSNNNQLTVAYGSNGLISTITDGASRVTQLIYTSNYLSSILKPDGLHIYFNSPVTGSYSKLTSITYENDSLNAAYYAYNVNNLLISAKTILGYTVNLEYSTTVPYRVTRYYENNTTVSPNIQGRDVHISYNFNTNVYTPDQYKISILQFNNMGQTVATRNGDYSANYQSYDEEVQKLNKVSTTSRTQRTVVNLFSNPSMERNANWTYSYWGSSTYGSGSYATDFAFIGSRSLKLTSSTNAANIHFYQIQPLTEGKTYTASAYAKCNTHNSTVHAYADVYLEFVCVISGVVYNGPLSNKISGNTDWTRLKVTFTVPSNSTSHTIRLRMVFTEGDAWFDALQLEEGYAASPYNLVENSDFTNNLTSWTTNSGTIVNVDPLDIYHPSILSPQCVQLLGAYGQNNYVYQYIAARGSAEDNFIYSAWARATSIPLDGDNGHYRMVIGYKGLDDVYSYEYKEFNHDPQVWQYLSSQSTAPFDYKELLVGFEYNNNANTAYVDSIELYKDILNTDYTYSVNGNLTQTSDLQNSVSSLDYSSNNDVITQRDAKGYEVNSTYDTNHNLKTVSTAANVNTSNNFDTHGNVTDSQVGTGTVTDLTQYLYDSTGSYAIKVTDSRGYFTQYNYNVNKGKLMQYIDARGETTSYDYNYSNLHQLVFVENYLTSENIYFRQYYSYSDNRLSQINCYGFNYLLNYNGLGNLSSVAVNSTHLADYNYDLARGLLTSIQYANSQTVYYSYEILGDRLTQTMTNVGNVFNFKYDNFGNLVRIENQDKSITTNITYDALSRPVSVLRSDSIEFHYGYDNNGNLAENIDIITGVTKTTSYQFDGDNRLFSMTLDNGMSYFYNYNAIGSVSNISCEVPGLNVSIKYLDGINGHKTSLISSFARCSDAYLYEYDANGNITRVTHGAQSVKYTYNEINVLTREDNGFINKSYVFKYNLGGNMTQRISYAYTEGTLGSPTTTDTFGYDATWADKLVSYNSNTIVSDQVGNPTTYMGYTITWFGGRRLKQLTGNSKTIVYEYNEDNIRTSKTVNSITTTFYLNNNRIVSQKTGNDTFYYSYDSMNKPVSILYKDNVYYYYIFDGLNNVVGLADSNGNTVVSYIYDAWGNIFSVTGTMAATLGIDNPFRYKGYFYDEETKFYYLQSRYYDPYICRFINADDFKQLYNAPGDILGANMFAYCRNNPVMRVDFSGKYYISNSQLTNVIRKVLIAFGLMPVSAGLLAFGFWTLYKFISTVVYSALISTASILGPIIWIFIGLAGTFLADFALNAAHALIQGKGLYMGLYRTKWGMPYWYTIYPA